MRRRDLLRPAAMMLGALAITVGLAACGSSDDSSTTTLPAVTAPVTVPVAINAPDSTTSGPATEPPTSVAIEIVGVSDAEVADLEKQLDEIDQLLAGIDADLSQD